MIFYGFQKLTLLDYPGKTACTVFTAGCNFRCPFCHNSGLVLNGAHNEAYSEDDIIAYLTKRRGILDGIAISGGEPLLHKKLPDFLTRVKELSFLIKLDTNGSFPDRLERIVNDRLVDYIAMDIKASPENYSKACGINADTEKIKESIRLLRSGNTEHEFRTTAVKGIHDPEEIEKICSMIGSDANYYIQNFVDSGNLLDPKCSGLSREEMLELLDTAKRSVNNVQLRGI